jgi:hypothetical protein
MWCASGVRSASDPTSCSGASAANGFFEIGEAFDKEKRRDVRNVKVIEQNSLVEVETLERGFVEYQYRPLWHRRRLSGEAGLSRTFSCSGAEAL